MCETPTAAPKPLDLNKPLQTVSGLAVRLFAHDRYAPISGGTLVGGIRTAYGELITTWYETGRHGWTYGQDGGLISGAVGYSLANVPEPAAFDHTKPAWTRDGRRAFLSLRRKDRNYPFIGMVEGDEEVSTWTAAGNYDINYSESAKDLTNEAPSR